MKVSELTGASLDYWVAKAEGLDAVFECGMCQVMTYADSFAKCYSERRYHDSWTNAGPIIEREGISIGHHEWYLEGSSKPPTSDYWRAYLWKPGMKKEIVFADDLPLANAMRCYVASKYGEEVPDNG